MRHFKAQETSSELSSILEEEIPPSPKKFGKFRDSSTNERQIVCKLVGSIRVTSESSSGTELKESITVANDTL